MHGLIIQTPKKMSLELPVVFPVVYQWKSAVKFGGITTDKTVDFSGKTVVLVIPMISIYIYQWITVVLPSNFTADFRWYTTGKHW